MFFTKTYKILKSMVGRVAVYMVYLQSFSDDAAAFVWPLTMAVRSLIDLIPRRLRNRSSMFRFTPGDFSSSFYYVR